MTLMIRQVPATRHNLTPVLLITDWHWPAVQSLRNTAQIMFSKTFSSVECFFFFFKILCVCVFFLSARRNNSEEPDFIGLLKHLFPETCDIIGIATPGIVCKGHALIFLQISFSVSDLNQTYVSILCTRPSNEVNRSSLNSVHQGWT